MPQDAAPMAATANSLPDERRKGRKGRPRCADCFFHQNMLCALGLKDGCPTFRPAHPDGLRPPQQLSFAFRHERQATPRAALPPNGGWREPHAYEG